MIFEYFKKKKEQKKELDAALRMKNEIEKQRKQEEEDNRVRMESSVPWYKLVGKPYDTEHPPVEPISERYQWNKAFVVSLREQGYKGEADYQVIHDWEVKTEENRVKRLIELDKANKKNSDEPWVDIESEGYDNDNKQVSMTLDWNAAFIKMLRQNGYSGASEQEIVDKWFKQLSENIASELHSENFNG